MQKDKSFVGDHHFYDDLGNPTGSFVVFRINEQWFWQSRPLETFQPIGPYPDAESAYLGAIGD